MNITEMETALRSAQAELDRADFVATQLANMLVGRLSKVRDRRTLVKLKAELKRFNAASRIWMHR